MNEIESQKSNVSKKDLRTIQIVGQVSFYDRIYSAQGYQGAHEKRNSPGIKVELVDLGTNEQGECSLSPFQSARIQAESAQNVPLSAHSPLSPGRLSLTDHASHTDFEIIQHTYTTSQGHFSFLVHLQAQHCYQVRALSELKRQHAKAQVLDHRQNARLYGISRDFMIGVASLDSSVLNPISIQATERLILPSLTAAPESYMAGALNILQNTYLGYELIQRYSDLLAPVLKYRWERGIAVSCGSCYRGGEVLLGGQIEDPDQYDDHIILHEMGHYFVDHWSEDHSPGGPHRGRYVSPQLAYGEGVAYFWSALVLDDPLIVDWMIEAPWVVDIENSIFNGEEAVLGVEGDSIYDRQHEELISTMMWDAHDELGDGEDGEVHDFLSIGEALSMYLLIDAVKNRVVDTGPEGVDLSDWLNELFCLSDAPIEESTNHSIDSMLDWFSYNEYPLVADDDFTCMKSDRHPFAIDTDMNLIKNHTLETLQDDGMSSHHVNAQPINDQQQNWHIQWYQGSPPHHKKQVTSIFCDALPCSLKPLLHEINDKNTQAIIIQVTDLNTHKNVYLSWLNSSYQKINQRQKGRVWMTSSGVAHILSLTD